MYGGKARSIEYLHTAENQRRDLQGEHGFRFFPGFYRHIINTMDRIPFLKTRTVTDNLLDAPWFMIARTAQAPLISPSSFPVNWSQLLAFLKLWFVQGIGVPTNELLHFLRCLMVMMTSCDDRYRNQFEWIPYWDFIGAKERSEGYQTVLGQGLTRVLVAMKAELSSTRTIGKVFSQMIYSWIDPFDTLDRLLNGPTSEVFIFPWISRLQDLGVKFVTGQLVIEFAASPDGKYLETITLTPNQLETTVLRRGVDFDIAVSALPVDAMTNILCRPGGDAFVKAARALSGLKNLETRWMNGIQFYLATDVPLVQGHINFIDSLWALTAISQRQFWTHCDLSTCGDGRVHGLLSVDISEWTVPGVFTTHKRAMDCDRNEVAREVWAQVKATVNVDGKVLLDDSMLMGYFMDNDITPGVSDVFASDNKEKNPYGNKFNLEPLFINTVGSLENRPSTESGLENFFLASDYVRTYTDVATMEAANESGRRACNAILDAMKLTDQRAEVWPLHQPWYVRTWQWLDQQRYNRGLPNLFSTPAMQHKTKPGGTLPGARAASAGQ